MNRIVAGIVLIAALALPAGAAATPDESDKRAAIAQCKAERGKTKATRKAFKQKYHSFSRCVKAKAAKEEAKDEAKEEAAEDNAAKQCAAERSDPGFAAAHGGKTFTEYYGSGPNGKNAFGKCVSEKVRGDAESDKA